MENPKLGAAFIFNVQLYLVEIASLQSGSTAIFNCIRPALSMYTLHNKCFARYNKSLQRLPRYAELWEGQWVCRMLHSWGHSFLGP